MDKEWVDLRGKNRQDIQLEKKLGYNTWKRDREIWQGKMTKLLHGKEMEKSDMEKRQKDLTYKKTGRFDIE